MKFIIKLLVVCSFIFGIQLEARYGYRYRNYNAYNTYNYNTYKSVGGGCPSCNGGY